MAFPEAVPRQPLEARKQPVQARSRMTLDAILDAATRVLTMESLSGFNTNRVAEVAGVSVGSLYQYFPNKAALMSALIDREQLRLATALEAAVERNAGMKRSALETVDLLRDAAATGQAKDRVAPAPERKPPELDRSITKPFEIGI